jgi:hypothetical protein
MSQTAPALGLFCKSFSGDFDHLAVLLESLDRHNPEKVVLTLSLPDADIGLFRNRFGSMQSNLTVVADEDYCGHDLTRYPGWLAQQICKLTSWKVMSSPCYVILDSDCYLIRDLVSAQILPQSKRFVVYGSKVRTVLKEGNDDLLRYIRGEMNPATYTPTPFEPKDRLNDYLEHRAISLEKLDPIRRSDIPMKVFGAKQWIYYQPCQIFCRDVLVSLHDFVKQHGIDEADLIKISPWEYNWYGEYISAHFFTETDFKVSQFVHVQEEADIAFAKKMGLTEEVLADRFFFVAMASRHLRHKRLDEA